jgi:gamma-glutamyl:cysteine ligase YbdK (ATP-grasp superfamily)
VTVPIYCNGKRILKIQNRMFDLLHAEIIEIIEKDEVEVTLGLEALLKKTDQGDYGPGGVIADIADYLKTKQEVIFFAELVKKSIEINKDFFNTIEGGMHAMQSFHQELLKYAEELKV